MKKWIYFIVIILFFSVVSMYTYGKNVSSIKIMYTSSLNGNLDGCPCRTDPKAGLVKRAAFLRSITDRSDVILVDTGDILDSYPDEPLAEEIFKIYDELGYDAIGLGDHELSNGVKKLLEYREDFPLMSHNFTINQDDSGRILFSSEPMIIDKGTVKIGIFSLISPKVFNRYSEKYKKHIRISRPEKIAEKMVFSLRKEKVDIKVLLYHGGYESAEKLAENIKGIDVIVVGHEQKLIEGEKAGNAIIVSPGAEGNYLGTLELYILNDDIIDYKNMFRIFRYEVDPDDPSIRERLNKYNAEKKSRLIDENS